jgi:RNA polymerase sigma-70 factor (ECF subfamily)
MPQSLDTAKESSWLQLFQRGDHEQKSAVFKEIFEHFRFELITLCLSLTGSSSMAEDAVQETFLSAFVALPGFRGEARLSTWLYRIAIRASYRARANYPRATESIPEHLAGAPPEEELLQRDKMRRLQRAMLQLPMEQRVVFSLFIFKHLSQKEIAEVLQVPEGTVWSRLHAAKTQLIQILALDLTNK